MTFDRAMGFDDIASVENPNRVYICMCCETILSTELRTRPGLTDVQCDWCTDHCSTDRFCTRYNNSQIPRLYTIPGMVYRLWEWQNFEESSPMPDRLNDTLANSEPSRHRLICRTCGYVVKGNTVLGVRLKMKLHRRSHRC